jgi:hypothetical protein
MSRTVAVAVMLLLAPSRDVGFGPAAAQTPTASPIFVFHQPFWINLHHFLYVLGRVEAKQPDIKRRAVAGAPADEAAGLAALTDDERRVWRESVAAYAQGSSRLDAVFDDELVNTAGQLIRAGSSESLQGVELSPAVAATLARAAPIYRKAWWPRHDEANRRRTSELRALVDRHGQAMLAYITRAYQEPWPSDGYPIQMSAFSNWAGAFSTRGRVLVMSSLDPGTAGTSGLEIVFHEAMHQWDDETFAKLRRAAGRQKVTRIPDSLTHAMIFFTAGEAARSILPEHVPYAQGNGLWKQSNISRFRAALDQAWKPYLEGRTSLDAALDALIQATAQ